MESNAATAGTTAVRDGPAPPEKTNGTEFTNFLNTVQDGRLAEELDKQLRECVMGLMHHARNSGGKPKGVLKLRFDFKLDDGVLEVLANSEMTLPKNVGTRSIFYALEDGRVAEQNPKQINLDLPVRSVSAMAASAVRSVSATPGGAN